MGIFMGDLSVGLIAGIAFGVLFTVVIAIIAKNLEKKFLPLRAEISKVRSVICEGPASYKNGINAIGGWMFLSEDAIEFYCHKLNLGGENIPILLDDIVEVKAKGNQLIIKAKDKEYQFVVNKSKSWQESIQRVL